MSDYIKQTWPNRYAQELLVLSRKRVYATFISPNIFASYILMMVFLGAGLLITNFFQRRSILWLSVAIFVMIVSLLFTKSLGGILVFITTCLIFIFYTTFYLLPKLGFNKTVLKKSGWGIISGLIIFIATFVLFSQHRLIHFFNLGAPDNSIIQRFYYWAASFKMIKIYPLTGLGWRNLGSLYEFYKLPSANDSHFSHNIFLQITAETGILGLLGFLLIVAVFLRNGFRNIKSNSEDQGLKIGLFCAACAFLFHNLIDLSFYFSQVSFFWWIILGLFA